MSKQPTWKLVAQLGDVNPIDHDGYFIYVDETGVYDPEAEVLIVTRENDCGEPAQWTAYRFTLEPCTFTNGILSDNRYHPNVPAWFAGTEAKRKERPQDTTYLADLAGGSGIELEQLIEFFCSSNPAERAIAWQIVGQYHGWENLDQDPLTFTDRAEVEKRYEGEI